MKQMKVYSLKTEDMGDDCRVLSYSKSIYKPGKKPILMEFQDPFTELEKKIAEHMADGRMSLETKWFLVTIKTSNGTYVRTYSRDALRK